MRREMIQDLIVRETHNAQATKRESTFAVTIFFDLCIVNLAVYLHNQSSRVAVEIGNEAVNHLLAAKMQSIQFVPTHCLPEHHFRSRHLSPHLPRDFVLLHMVQPPHHPGFIHSAYPPPYPSREEGVT